MFKLFTPKYRGDLIVVSLLIVITLYFTLTSFSKGFSNQIYLLLMTIPIGIFLVNSLIREEPVVTTTQGMIVLILVIFLFGGAYIISQMYGGIFSFFYMIGFVFLVFYLNDKTTIFRIKKPSEYVSERDRIRSDDSRYIPSDVVNEVWERDHGRCVICGSQRQLELDHRIPFSKGGSNTANNIRILCKECNLRKSDKIE